MSIHDLGKESLEVLEKLRNLNFEKKVKSSYAPLRLEEWFGYSSNLQSIKEGRNVIQWSRDFPDWIDEMRTRYFPEANSCLVCKGVKDNSDTSIDWHRDHGAFDNRVVMINFGEAIFYLQTYNKGTIVKKLGDGEVIDFDSKLLHKSSQISPERFILTFRKVKRNSLKTELF